MNLAVKAAFGKHPQSCPLENANVCWKYQQIFRRKRSKSGDLKKEMTWYLQFTGTK